MQEQLNKFIPKLIRTIGMLPLVSWLEHQAIDVDKEEIRSLTSKLFNRKLTDGEYNRLVHQTIKEIKVYHDKIDVETYFGNITLPRRKVMSWLALPTYIWNNNPDHYGLYYYFNTPNIYGKKKLLFKNKELTIYFIEDTQQMKASKRYMLRGVF